MGTNDSGYGRFDGRAVIVVPPVQIPKAKVRQ